MVCASIFAGPSDPRIMLDSHRHEKLKECQDFNVHFCQVYLVEFTCCILESAASLKRLTYIGWIPRAVTLDALFQKSANVGR
jgi:hypothetical protein